MASPRDKEDTSRISITAHHTAYTWCANGLSHRAFATPVGKAFYYSAKPWMFLGRTVLGVSDLETGLVQRHLILDHLLDQAVRDRGVTQVLELACGLSPRGFRFTSDPEHKHVTYVEADLPGMARNKKHLLLREGLLGQNHHVVHCNILAQEGEHSLEAVARQHLDPSQPTAIITEGLINYFDMGAMKGLWSRIAALLHSFSGGVYLSDNMPRPQGHPLGFLLYGWNQLVKTIARGGFFMHFSSDAEAGQAFLELGFNQAFSHKPESFFKDLPLPASRLKSFLRVLEARV